MLRWPRRFGLLCAMGDQRADNTGEHITGAGRRCERITGINTDGQRLGRSNRGNSPFQQDMAAPLITESLLRATQARKLPSVRGQHRAVELVVEMVVLGD